MPSAADLRRFDRDDISCPNCGTDVYHDAALCQACGYAITRSSRTRKPSKVGAALLILAAAGMVLGFVGWMF